MGILNSKQFKFIVTAIAGLANRNL